VANNIAYPDYDYATQQFGKPFDPASPHNDSPNNTGLGELPAAQPAILWYPRQPTTEFPGMGQGGMNIMVGPVFRSEHYPFSDDKLPDYFDGKLLFYDWVRGWVKAASLNEKQQIVQVEPFIDTLHFAHPTDMRLGPEGALYVLDYGSESYAKNLDAKVVRISYARGNRKPVPKISASKTEGALPLEVSLSAAGSFDYDQDSLAYAWMIEGKRLPGKNIDYLFEKPGVHTVKLEIKDKAGAVSEKSISIMAGNAPPEISLNTNANRSFYWPGQKISYQVEVTDQEDGSLTGGQIANEEVKIRFTFQPSGEGKNSSGNIHDIPDGKLLVQENGCVACHGLDTRSLGPSYTEVALRYKGKGQQDMLTKKIINGGEGNWQMNRAMPAHQFIEEAEARKMVSYILSLADRPLSEDKAVSGMLSFDQAGAEASGIYTLEISYEDRGGEKVGPIKRSRRYTFMSPSFSASSADYWQGVAQRANGSTLVQKSGGYLMYQNIDLRQISRIEVRLKALVTGRLEVMLNDSEGELLASAALDKNAEWHQIHVPLQETPLQQDIFFVFSSEQAALPSNLFLIDSFHFLQDEPER
jgi:cytochrome c